MNDTAMVIDAMTVYFAGDARRINHFLKVYGFAKAIGEIEALNPQTQKILELAAVTHDIGIKNSELKYGSAAGNYQETEGPPEALKLLNKLGFDKELIRRVCWLIAHHHTYGDIRDIDHQILVEADFLVNAYEDGMTTNAIDSVRRTVFKTNTGKRYLDMIYGAY